MNSNLYMRNIVGVLVCSICTFAYAQWQPVAGWLTTDWSAQVDPSNVHGEHPYPLMERKEWMSLNGLWNYAIRDKGMAEPMQFDGKILVPYPIESSLSGVGKRLTAKQELWYEREFELPRRWQRRDILLHLGAVDYKADVWINDSLVISHEGGYGEMTVNVSRHLYRKGLQRIVVRVWDPTDSGSQPRGKQVANPNGIWYTPVSGIWQTVWIEPVDLNYLEDLRVTTDIDEGTIMVESNQHFKLSNAALWVTIYDGKRKVVSKKSKNGQYVILKMPEGFKLWSPDNPFLYRMKVELRESGIVIDEVKSYVAMRKFTSEQDSNGIPRICLNHKPIFLFGPLDQGWWPDGLYTAPTDAAMLYDLQKTKQWGFNMVRKHVKVEPARWYTYCDQLGLIVWQDMPSGGETSPKWQPNQFFDGDEVSRSEESDLQYRHELHELIRQHESYPCIAVWVPFNEAWGQYNTEEIAMWTRHLDSSRLVDAASGGNHYYCGDILDIHHYPNPAITLSDPNRITVLGEYGGIGMAAEGHLWAPDRNWGYVQYKSPKEVTDQYVVYATKLKELIRQGLSAAVYTQTTDVETEVNGIMTYDRRMVKMDEATIRAINTEVIGSLK